MSEHKLIAFHGNPQIKEAVLTQLRAHHAADEIIKGVYWADGKGCAVGCTIHSGNHAEYEPRFGIPQLLARLEDGIFEALPNENAKEWPIRFMEAIPIGADLSMVAPQFMHWLLVDAEHGVIRFADEQGRTAIQGVADLYARQIGGNEVSIEDWRAARAAADAAAYAAYAADAAADAAAYAADAARAAADAAARAAADAAARINQSEKLLTLLASAPIADGNTLRQHQL